MFQWMGSRCDRRASPTSPASSLKILLDRKLIQPPFPLSFRSQNDVAVGAVRPHAYRGTSTSSTPNSSQNLRYFPSGPEGHAQISAIRAFALRTLSSHFSMHAER